MIRARFQFCIRYRIVIIIWNNLKATGDPSNSFKVSATFDFENSVKGNKKE